jgi:hypothetical protein
MRFTKTESEYILFCSINQGRHPQVMPLWNLKCVVGPKRTIELKKVCKLTVMYMNPMLNIAEDP